MSNQKETYNWKEKERRIGNDSIHRSLQYLGTKFPSEEAKKQKLAFFRSYYWQKRIYEAEPNTGVLGFRTVDEAELLGDPEAYAERKAEADFFRFNPLKPYPYNCKRKIHFLEKELEISSNTDLIKLRIHGCRNLAEAWERRMDLPMKEEFNTRMSGVIGFKKFKAELESYLITAKFYQSNGAIVPQQVYLLLGPPGVGKSYIAAEIARALNKQFINFNCASAKISELVGIAPDYTGKDFGRIVKSMIEGKDRSPVIIFDEIDKCADKEVSNTISVIFDSTKNASDFQDVYFGFPVPLNECFLMCTANYVENLEQFVLSRCTRVMIEPLNYAQRMRVARNELQRGLKQSKDPDVKSLYDKFGEKFFHRTLCEEWGVRGIRNNVLNALKQLMKHCVHEVDAQTAKFDTDKFATMGSMDKYAWDFRYYREFGTTDRDGRRVPTCLAGKADGKKYWTNQDIDGWKKNWQKKWVEDWKNIPGNIGIPPLAPKPPEDKVPKLHVRDCECFLWERIPGLKHKFEEHSNNQGEKKDIHDDDSWKDPAKWTPFTKEDEEVN